MGVSHLLLGLCGCGESGWHCWLFDVIGAGMITKQFVRYMLNTFEYIWEIVGLFELSNPLYEGLWKRFEINVVNGNSNDFERKHVDFEAWSSFPLCPGRVCDVVLKHVFVYLMVFVKWIPIDSFHLVHWKLCHSSNSLRFMLIWPPKVWYPCFTDEQTDAFYLQLHHLETWQKLLWRRQALMAM